MMENTTIVSDDNLRWELKRQMERQLEVKFRDDSLGRSLKMKTRDDNLKRKSKTPALTRQLHIWRSETTAWPRNLNENLTRQLQMEVRDDDLKWNSSTTPWDDNLTRQLVIMTTGTTHCHDTSARHSNNQETTLPGSHMCKFPYTTTTFQRQPHLSLL